MAAEVVAGKKSPYSDDSIKFRPSPNFKHMKKYLKSKFEEMSALTNVTETKVESEETNVIKVEDKATQNKQEKAKPLPPPPPPPPPPPTVQPPLPPNPPPPDSPPVTIKQEIVDYEYGNYYNAVAGMTGNDDNMLQYTTEMPQAPPKPGGGVIMCRNFVRGTCTKGSACIFAHELIVEQLPGVYTFCRNFQNRQCTFARCKFVHATVFEKEYFYRTGYLPPHALMHLKVQPPPPPPPPPEDPPAPAQVPVQGPTQGSAQGSVQGSVQGQVQMPLQVQEVPQAYYAMDMNMGAMPFADMNCASVPTYMLQNPLPAIHEQHNLYGPSTSAGTGQYAGAYAGTSAGLNAYAGASTSAGANMYGGASTSAGTNMYAGASTSAGANMFAGASTSAAANMFTGASTSAAANMFAGASTSAMQNIFAGPSTTAGTSTAAGPSTSQLKRDWMTAMTEEASYTQTETTNTEPAVKKCKDCDTVEFRYQYNKNKVENMISSSDELNKNMNQLNIKTQRLCMVLLTLFKPQTPMQGLGGMNALGEKDKAILEQLNLMLGTNTSMPVINEDENVKSFLGNNEMNFNNIMTQLLMNSGDQTAVQ